MSNPTPILNNINAFDATKGTTISFNIIGGTDIVRSNIAYIYDLSTNDLICTHLYISTESIHELPPNTDSSIVYASGKSSADFVNNKNYYLQIQTFTNTAGTAGGSGMSVAKTFWCLFNPALSVNAIPAAISTTSYNVGATYTTNITDATIPVTNIIQQYKFDLYTATGTLVQTSGNIIGSGEQEGTSTTYNITYNFSGLVVNNSYYVVVTTTSTEGMTVSAQSNTFTVSIETPTVGGAIVNNNACDGYISVVSNLSDEYGGHVSGEMASFETDSVNNVSSLKVNMEPIQEGSGTPSPTNIRPIRGHSGVNAYVSPTQSADDGTKYSQEFDVSLTPTSTDKVPYTFKAVGRDVYGDRESDKIVGGTVAWNQLVQNGNFADTSVWSTQGYGTLSANGNVGTFTISQATTSARIEQTMNPIKGHKYLAIASIKPNKAFDVVMSFRTTGAGTYIARQTMTANAWNYIFGVRNAVDSDLESNVFRVYPFLGTQTVEVGDTIQFRDIICFDLTALFNPTIADYIYSLEQSQAGAGVAWFRRYFPKSYYPYDPGTLRSVEGVSAHETVGFNQWDEEWEVGVYKNTNGKKGSTTGEYVRSKGYIPCFPNTTYYANKPLWYCFYDGDKNFIGYRNMSAVNTFVTPSDCHYMTFNTQAGYGTTYNHDICINISDPSRNGEYEPYTKHTYPLDSSLTLRGVPKLVDGKLAFDGDVYPPSGEVQRRYNEAIITDSMITMVGASYSNVVYAEVHVPSDGKQEYTKGGMLTKYGVAQSQSGTWDSATHVGNFYMNAARDTFWVGFAHGTSLADMRTALVGMTLLYELATPTTETAEPFTNPQVVDNRGTEAYVTTGIVPVGHDSEYLTRDIFSGTLDLVTGVLTVDRAMVDLGRLNWGYSSADARFYNGDLDYKRPASATDVANAVCSQYEIVKLGVLADGKMCLYTNGYMYVKDSRYTDATAFKTAMNGVQLVYELATPQTYQLTPQQIQTLVGVNNVWSEQGDVELSYHIPITNLLVKRQDVADVSGTWLTLYSQPITQASDMDFTFIDFLNQYGKTYKYALVPLLTQQQGDIDVEIEGGYTVSDDVLSVFDGVFIANNNGSQKLKAATEYGDLETNQDVGVLTTIGGKYPFVVSNSNLNYHSGSISALIVPSDFYTSGDLDRLDIVERREAIEQFLTDKTAKILKDWNGNIWLITFVENVEVSFVDDYGMGLGTLSAKWVEIGDVNDQTDLKQTGLI